MNNIDIYAGLPADPSQRLAYKIAVMQAFADGKPAQIDYAGSAGAWVSLCPEPDWDWRVFTYRIDPASRPKKLVPWTAADVPALCWLRNKGLGTTSGSLVIEVNSNTGRIWYLGRDGANASADFCQVFEYFEWSADRKTWAPCGKEI